MAFQLIHISRMITSDVVQKQWLKVGFRWLSKRLVCYLFIELSLPHQIVSEELMDSTIHDI